MKLCACADREGSVDLVSQTLHGLPTPLVFLLLCAWKKVEKNGGLERKDALIIQGVGAESEGFQPRQDLGQLANLACSVWRLSSGLLHRPTQGSWDLDCGNGRGSEG